MTGGEGNKRAGIMIPIPQYPLYTASIAEYNAYGVGTVGPKYFRVTGLPLQCRPRSDFFYRNSLIRVFNVINSDSIIDSITLWEKLFV